jgi:hypothetical protein
MVVKGHDRKFELSHEFLEYLKSVGDVDMVSNPRYLSYFETFLLLANFLDNGPVTGQRGNGIPRGIGSTALMTKKADYLVS